MADTKYQEEPIAEGQEQLTVGGDMVLLPESEPLNAFVLDIAKIQAPNFKNPAVLEPKYSLKFKVTADVDGKGQVYAKWVTPSLHPKSSLFDLAQTLIGKLEEGATVDPVKLKGKPCRILLKNVEKDGVTYQRIDRVLAPAKAKDETVVSP